MKMKRILFVSCAIILLCMCIIIGSTYALFTDKLSVGNHLEAGYLNITLQRTYLEYKILNEKGLLEKTVNDEVFDFTDNTTRNIFGLEDTDIKIAPGSYFEAKLRVLNDNSKDAVNFSNVAFNYSVEIVLVKGSEAFVNQMQVTVTDHNGKSTTMRLSEIINGNKFEVGTVLAGEAGQEFVVKVEFLDDLDYTEMDNDLVKGEELIFDLVVSAVQVSD